MTRFQGIYVALGSNLGDRRRLLDSACAALDNRRWSRLLARSSYHEFDAVGGPAGQPRFLNAAVQIETSLSPGELLRELLAIETQHGRVRDERFGPRTLDLDLLLYHDRVVRSDELELPHPRMWERPFVLTPLAEICDLEALRGFFAASMTHLDRRGVPEGIVHAD